MTGGKDNSGTVYTFFTQKDRKKASDLIRILKKTNQVVNPQLYEMEIIKRTTEKTFDELMLEHKTKYNLGEKEFKYQCDTCSVKCKTAGLLRRHTKNEHEWPAFEAPVIPCNLR